MGLLRVRQGGDDEFSLWGTAACPKSRSAAPCSPCDLRRNKTTPPVDKAHMASTSHRFANMRPSGHAVIVRYLIEFEWPRIALSHHSTPLPSPVRQFREHRGCFRSNWKGGLQGRIA
jgi:hypothetical protein